MADRAVVHVVRPSQPQTGGVTIHARPCHVWLCVVALTALGACDSTHWNHAECEQQADKEVRAVSALERRKECNSPQQCDANERERAAINQTRREAHVFACMQSRGFVFDAEGWARDQREKHERPRYVYWTRPH
jgi:hypothetical protein